jgi:hypothetical protein
MDVGVLVGVGICVEPVVGSANCKASSAVARAMSPRIAVPLNPHLHRHVTLARNLFVFQVVN